MKEHKYEHNQDIVKFIAFVNGGNGCIYYVATDEHGKILSIYDLHNRVQIRSVHGTTLYVDYVVDTSCMKRSILSAMGSVLDIKLFMGAM
jgi:hypothetical protein